MKTNLFKYIIVFSILLIGCTDDFLEVKPDSSLIVPETPQEYQLLMDNNMVMNINTMLNFMIGDEYVVLDAQYNILPTPIERNAYIWASDVYEGTNISDWENGYKVVFYANTVIEGVLDEQSRSADPASYNEVLGTAYFFRAHSYFNMIRAFAPAYDPSEGEQLGIPIRVSSAVDAIYPRATLEENYASIISDLETARALLPVVNQPFTRPSQLTVDFLLARVYLLRGAYEQALEYANRVIAVSPDLIDYNTLNPNAVNTIPQRNEETIFYANNSPYSLISLGYVAPSLYSLYETNDLRRALFFRQFGTNIQFRGHYTGNVIHFGGMSINEAYLIAAECEARVGSIDRSMELLNTLLLHRYETGTYVPKVANERDEALDLVLLERRKELAFRGLRGDDLKRLNKDPRLAVTLTRTLNGETYTLPPNDPRYVWPLPDLEVELGGLEQNPR